MIKVSICLSDIKKEEIKTSEKNGKEYINITIDNRKEKGKFGETHNVWISQDKEERNEKKDKHYVGSGREYIMDEYKTKESGNAVKEDLPLTTESDNGGLPF